MTLKEQAIEVLNYFKKSPDCLCHICNYLHFPALKSLIQKSVNNYHELIKYEYKNEDTLHESALLPKYSFSTPEFYEARIIFMEELIKQL